MIDFELSDGLKGMQQLTHQAAEMAMRPIAREYDEREHEKPWDFLNMMWAVSHSNPIGGTGERKAKEGPSERNLGMCVSIEELSWGDAGLYLSIPNARLGGAAVPAALVFEDCRIPLDNILGSPEVPKTSEGFKGVMATFDATRPIVAASAIGVGRAALDFVRETLEQHGIAIRYGLPPHKLTALERDFMEMEVQLQAARLLTWRAAWMMDNGMRNNLEASMAKAKAGLVVTQVTQKAVEMLGPLGYSRQLLLEKWMRDAKINDIFEGTQQISQMIVARRILGYSSKELS